jgi:hypothetical protein
MLRSVGLTFAALLLIGCDDAVGPNSLSYEGITTILSAKPMSIQTTVTARNVSSRTVRIDRNICPTRYTAHASASREDTPLWTYPAPGPIECAAWAGPLDLAPGDYYQFQTQVTLPSTTPDGLQFLTLHFALRDDVALPVGQVTVNQGTVYRP